MVHGLCTQLIQLVAVPARFDKIEWYSRGMTLNADNNFATKDPSIDGLLYEHLHEWRLNLKTGMFSIRMCATKYRLLVSKFFYLQIVNQNIYVQRILADI